MEHRVNPATDRCVMCGRNSFNRKHTPECDYRQPTPPAGNSPVVDGEHTDMFGTDLTKTDSFETPRAESDPWKAAHRIKLHHEQVYHAAMTVVNVAEWQGEGREKYLAEAIAELKAALGKLTHLHPPTEVPGD